MKGEGFTLNGFHLVLVLLGILNISAKPGELNIHEIASPDPWTRQQASQHVIQVYEERVAGLLEIAAIRRTTYEEFSGQELAIDVLGDQRAIEADTFLVKHVSVWFPVITLEVHPLDNYPAARALVNIGVPALDAIRNSLDERKSDLDLQLFAWVFYLVDDRELAVERLTLLSEETRDLRRDQILEIKALLQDGGPPPFPSRTTREIRQKSGNELVAKVKDKQRLPPMLEALLSEDPSVRREAKQQLLEERQKLIEFLSGVVTASGEAASASHASRQLALELLGQVRAREAVALLLDQVEDPFLLNHAEAETLEEHPTVRTLAQVGAPALHGIRRSLKDEVTQEKLKLFAEVFRQVDGKELASVRLGQMIENEADRSRKSQLQEMLTFLEKGELAPTDSSPQVEESRSDKEAEPPTSSRGDAGCFEARFGADGYTKGAIRRRYESVLSCWRS